MFTSIIVFFAVLVLANHINLRWANRGRAKAKTPKWNDEIHGLERQKRQYGETKPMEWLDDSNGIVYKDQWNRSAISMDLFQKNGRFIHFIWQENDKKTAEKRCRFFVYNRLSKCTSASPPLLFVPTCCYPYGLFTHDGLVDCHHTGEVVGNVWLF